MDTEKIDENPQEVKPLHLEAVVTECFSQEAGECRNVSVFMDGLSVGALVMLPPEVAARLATQINLLADALKALRKLSEVFRAHAEPVVTKLGRA